MHARMCVCVCVCVCLRNKNYRYVFFEITFYDGLGLRVVAKYRVSLSVSISLREIRKKETAYRIPVYLSVSVSSVK